jgi:hypothetical protein
MDYKKHICELIEKIESEKSLERIYKLVRHLWMNEDAEDEQGKEDNHE